jgi:hypothetical protein
LEERIILFSTEPKSRLVLPFGEVVEDQWGIWKNTPLKRLSKKSYVVICIFQIESIGTQIRLIYADFIRVNQLKSVSSAFYFILYFHSVSFSKTVAPF